MIGRFTFLLLKLPKPVNFHTYSLQHFPGYALTKKALKAGHITEEELGDWPLMMRRTTENWSFVPIVTSGHYERRIINKKQAIRFGKLHKEPILQWTCKIKIGKSKHKNVYKTLNMETNEYFNKLIRLYVRGGPCYLTDHYDKDTELTKTTDCIFYDIKWNHKAPKLTSMQTGVIHIVPQPDLIILKHENKKTGTITFFSIKAKRQENKKMIINKKTRKATKPIRQQGEHTKTIIGIQYDFV